MNNEELIKKYFPEFAEEWLANPIKAGEFYDSIEEERLAISALARSLGPEYAMPDEPLTYKKVS
jgi:hypothetical protein